MSAFLHSMAWPFVACLLLAGILVYLGIHVISRKVIFVDLALAQIAALGSVWGVLLGWDLEGDPWTIKAFSLAFTFVGAAVFTMTRTRDERVPHEALIGITYAVALGATILCSAHLAHGAEEVSELLAGSILWVRAGDIAATALVFAVVGAFHWAFRRQFFLISLDPERAAAELSSLRLWDFLFYVSLGFAVTSAVAIAGVLLVFSYLVIPAVVAMLFAERIGPRLALGWTAGTIVSAVGCSLSYFQDLPSGPTIVACFGASLVVAGAASYVVRAAERGRASLRVTVGALALALLFGGSSLLRKHDSHDVEHLLAAGTKAERMMALAQVEAEPELWPRVEPLVRPMLREAETQVRVRLLDLVESRGGASFLPEVHALLQDADDSVRDRALRCVRAIGSPESIGPLLAAAAREEDEYIAVELAETVLELGDVRGIPLLIDVLETGQAAQARRDAWEHLKAHLAQDVLYHEEGDSHENAQAIAELRAWWRTHEHELVVGERGVVRVAR